MEKDQVGQVDLPQENPDQRVNQVETNDFTIAVKAAPMITPTARSITFPRAMNSLNSFNIRILAFSIS